MKPESRQLDKNALKKNDAIPYMAMTFAPLERRLDTAVFRAVFASSARPARQLVVHGAVKVKKGGVADVLIHLSVKPWWQGKALAPACTSTVVNFDAMQHSS